MTRAGILSIAAVALLACTARAGLEQPVDNIHTPTAGLLSHREYRFQARLTPESSIQGGGRIGLWDRLQLGVFYGVQRIVETGSVGYNDHVGFEVRTRLFDEARWPALAVGFNSQGWYEYNSADERYDRKSLGFYAVGSKNWRSFAGDLSLHAGVNYSLETADGDEEPDFFAAADWTIAGRVELLGEMTGARNDNNEDGKYGEGGVYVDAGVRVGLGDHLSVMLVFSDLTRNLAPGEDVGRELEIVYLNWF
jgi:hypothetical protein